jgi:hypothetical protein
LIFSKAFVILFGNPFSFRCVASCFLLMVYKSESCIIIFRFFVRRGWW